MEFQPNISSSEIGEINIQSYVCSIFSAVFALKRCHASTAPPTVPLEYLFFCYKTATHTHLIHIHMDTTKRYELAHSLTQFFGEHRLRKQRRKYHSGFTISSNQSRQPWQRRSGRLHFKTILIFGPQRQSWALKFCPIFDDVRQKYCVKFQYFQPSHFVSMAINNIQFLDRLHRTLDSGPESPSFSLSLSRSPFSFSHL